MVIKRDYYLNKLISRKGNGLIKIITGIRRCGKSFLLNKIFYDHLIESGVDDEHIIRFAFDNGDDLMEIGENLFDLEKEKRPVDPEKFLKYIRGKLKDESMYYLLLDEVQRLGEFEAVLNGFLYKDNVDVFVTGSNAKFLSKDVITEFAGRGDECRMYPLSFSEFMSIYDGDRYTALAEYMYYGGIPLVVLRKNEEEKSRILENLFTEIYIRDIQKRNRIRNVGELEDTLNVLSSTIGSLTNPDRLKNTFKSVKKSKITSNTIRKYIDCFEDSFLLDSAVRYDIKGRAYISTPVKYYFTDLGLRNARLSFRQVEESHLLENLIFNELKMRGYNVDVGVVVTSGRNSNNRVVRSQLEVDFVCNRAGKTYYIQSAYALPDCGKREAEKRPLLKINDSFKKVIITRDIVKPLYDENGILTMDIFDFLLDPESLDKY